MAIVGVVSETYRAVLEKCEHVRLFNIFLWIFLLLVLGEWASFPVNSCSSQLPEGLRQRFPVLLIPKKQSPETLDWLVYWFVKTVMAPCKRRRGNNINAFEGHREERLILPAMCLWSTTITIYHYLSPSQNVQWSKLWTPKSKYLTVFLSPPIFAPYFPQKEKKEKNLHFTIVSLQVCT